MRVLITGAGGFIGRACVAGFSASGWQVRAISRRIMAAPAQHVEMEAINSLADADWPALLKDVDCVLHLAGVAHQMAAKEQDYWDVNVHATTRLARAAVAAQVHRFIYLSSIAVYGRSLRSGMLDESSQVMPEDVNGRTKAAAEQCVQEIAQEAGMGWTIVRPPLVYGPDAPGNFNRLARWLRRGLPLPLSAANAPRSYVGVDNLVSALLCIASSKAAANRIYLVSDNDDLGTADLIRLMARALGRACRLWWLPPSVLRLGAAMLGRSTDADRLLGRLQVDSSAIRRELNWAPPLSAAEGIARSLR